MAIDAWGRWDGQPDYGTPTLQSGSTGGSIQVGGAPAQGSSPQLQASNTGTGDQRLSGDISGGVTLGARTGFTADEIAAQQAAAAEAQRAAEAARLRGQVTDLINAIRGTYDQRYGKIDASAGEQIGKLNERYANESGDVTRQVGAENEKIGAAHASSGTFDSSYRGNNVDTVTNAGKAQIRDLGTELADNTGKVGAWVASSKGGINAQKSGLDKIVSRLAETTDVGELTSLRAELDGRISQLQGEEADYNSAAQNAAALESVAPTTSRAVQLKTTLSQIISGNAPASQKAAIGQQLITSAGLDPEEAQALLNGFQTSLEDQKQQTQTA